MKVDDFIQCCAMLKTLTDAFRQHDTSQTGVVQINYEQVSFVQTCFIPKLTAMLSR
jgi:hypothetical protein